MITLIVLGICYTAGVFPPYKLILCTFMMDLILFGLAGRAVSSYVNK